jgi:tetratricopeptide (TPR) repeat protein
MRHPFAHWIHAAAVAALLFTAGTAYGAGPAEPGAHYFDQGRALLAEGKTTEGFKLLALSVNMAPDDMARQAYFLTYLDRNAYNWDVPLHEALVALAPTYPPLLQRLAKLYEGKQRYADAEALYLKWAALRPNQPEVYARLGEHYYFTGEYEKGLAAFARHRELVGESDYALRRMAAIRDRMGLHGEAGRLAARARGVSGETEPMTLAGTSPLAR